MPLIIEPTRSRPRRGSTLVEAAIVLPLLILVVFGLIEYGSLLLRLQQIENATRQAARYAATPDATQAATTTLISTLMTTAGMPNSSSHYTVTTTPTDIATASRGDQITIKISVTYNNIAITKSSLIPVPTTVSRTVVMAKEGPD
jgi:Flp pilus assembly protein TadG